MNVYKEICIDLRKNQRCQKPVYIKGEAVERVDACKYLGVVFDSELNWNENISSVLKKKKSEVKNVLLEKAKIIWSQFKFVENFYNVVICI